MLGTRVRRAVAAAAVATVVAIAPASAGAAAAPAVDRFCAATGTGDPFADVTAGPHHGTVRCLAALGVATGTTPTTFDPATTLRRDQLASFVARAVDTANRLELDGAGLSDVPAPGDTAFGDIDDGNVHQAAIGRLAAAGIVTGVGDGRFAPEAPVTRGQLASVLVRAEAFLTGEALTSTADHFTDDDGDVHEAAIDGIAAAGIATGTAPGTFSPGSPVTRAQLASFLVRWLARHHDAGRIGPADPAGGPDLLTVEVTDADGDGALSPGDPITLTYAQPVVVSSSITLTDANGTSVTLTDDIPTPPGATPATFTLADDGGRLVVVATAPIVFHGGTALAGPIVVTDAAGIVDAATGTAWHPAAEPADEVRFELVAGPAPDPAPAAPPAPAPATHPIVHDVDPAVGPAAGGTEVTIRGTRLAGATTVTFSGVAATDVTVIDSTELVAVAPPGTGTVAISVTTPQGTATAPAAYRYVAAPTITSVSPHGGTRTGGDSVTITGTDLADVDEVRFGAAPAVVLDRSATHLTVATPAAAATGTVDVAVQSPGGTATAADAFTYLAPPEVLSVEPDAGPLLGGGDVTITGTDLSEVTSVRFGATEATWTEVSPTELTAVAPPGVAGTVDVTVQTLGGSSSVAGAYRYVPAPVLTSLSEAAGPEAGGGTVTIEGTGLAGATVAFGATTADVLTATPTQLTVRVPPGTGTVDLALTTVGGTHLAEGAYTYAPAPVITSIAPAGGRESGHDAVTITGTGLAHVTEVRFGAAPGTITSATPTQLTVTTPEGTGTVDVEVASPGGTATAVDAFTYHPAPTISSVSDALVPAWGGGTVTVTGTGFAATTAVVVGGTPAPFSRQGSTVLFVTVPPGSGTADIEVVTPGGTATLPDAVIYVPMPDIWSFAPAPSGPSAGGNSLTMHGSGLLTVQEVTVGGTPATVTDVSDTQLTIIVPPGPPGNVDVSVRTIGGTVIWLVGYRYLE